MGQDRDKAIAFVVFSRRTGVASYGYRIWASNTSFYIKHRDIDLGVKISIHGPDPRHDQPGFKFGIDGSATLLHDTNAWRFEEGARMGWFLGAKVRPGVTHLARIRFPWSTFEPGSPSGRQPTTSKEIGQHLVVRAPEPLFAADIDLYLSETGRPYWPDEEQARINNAAMGPLLNDAGQFLTAVSVRRLLWRDQATEELAELAHEYSGKQMRTIVTNSDGDGFLWVREVAVPVAAMRRYSEDELREATRIPRRTAAPDIDPVIE